ncbi:hypothetical protein [Maribacter sp. ACAM166]|uniref:hypothetical protein n=1 Tax=Maribacter sp. ACAM166 TaxID=2508996 RepID=UPI002017FCE0|nr:hypothetical protein [Maribacter sp. ACAM166]
MADLKKISIGLQTGGQVITDVIFFEAASDLFEFKEGVFKFSAEASAIAVNAKYKAGVAVFSLSKAGLMADVSVGVQKFDYTPIRKQLTFQVN